MAVPKLTIYVPKTSIFRAVDTLRHSAPYFLQPIFFETLLPPTHLF